VVAGISRPPCAAALFGAACADQVTGTASRSNSRPRAPSTTGMPTSI